MSGAVQILSELDRLGVTIRMDGETLKLGPAKVLDGRLIEMVREAKPEILEFLRSRPETCADTCYRVDAARWIHHPWNGCKTIPLGEPGRVVEGPCFHCSGRKECGCIACCSPDGAGRCLACRGSGVTVGWVQ